MKDEIPPEDVERMLYEEARRVVDRNMNEYGPPDESFLITAKLWSSLLGINVQASQVPLMMILLKVARESFKHKDDNIVDIAGYADCIRRINGNNA